MRLKLVLKIVEGTVLPCNYMYELSSCLYKVLNEGNPVFTAWLEKPRDFDPFGHAGLSPLVTI